MARNGVIHCDPDANGVYDTENPAGFLQRLARTIAYLFAAIHSLAVYTGGDTALSTDDTNMFEWLTRIAGAMGLTGYGGYIFGQVAEHNAIWPPAQFLGDFENNTQTAWQGVAIDGPLNEQGFNFAITTFQNFGLSEPGQSAAVRSTEAIALFNNFEASMPGVQKVVHWNWWDVGDASGYQASIGEMPFVNVDNLTSEEFGRYLLTQLWSDSTRQTRSFYFQYHMTVQANLAAQFPEDDFIFVPIGPVWAEAVTNLPFLTALPFSAWIGDSSGHGTRLMYFFAGIVMAQALYRQRLDFTGFVFPPRVAADPPQAQLDAFQDNLALIESYTWNRLEYFETQGVRTF